VLSDLSFLNIGSTKEGAGASSYCLQKSHISIVICGSDNLQWVGYAFANSIDDDGDDESDGSETDEDKTGEEGEDEDKEEDEGGYKADLFASDDS
jgi:hypothetical protein